MTSTTSPSTSPSTSPGTSSGTAAHPLVRRSGSTPTRGRGRRTGLVGGLVGAALLLMGAPAVAADGGPGGRRLVDHTVRAGETATGLAVRYHAWTAELISHNHLGSSAALHVGQHVEIPVVVAALRHRTHRAAPHRLPDPRTARVRRAVAGAANRAGVDPHLALAVAWQESGWQMDRRSGAGAIGAMQVLPGTGRWMSLYAGRPLHLRRLGDNATAGTTLLRVLDRETPTTRRAIGAYYQGLGAVREHGLYRDTRAYVANVTAIRDRLEAGRPPA